MATGLHDDPNDATTTYTQPTAMPTAKIAAATVSGAIATLLVYIAGLYGIHFPAGVESAIGVLAAVAAGYIKKSDTAQGAK